MTAIKTKMLTILLGVIFIASNTSFAQTCVTVGSATGTLSPVLKSNPGFCSTPATLTNVCDCPTGFVAVGYEAEVGNFYGPLVHSQFTLRCRELNQDGTLGNTVSLTCSNGTANGNTQPAPDDANANEALVGAQLRIGCAVDRVTGNSKPIADIIAGSPNSTNTTMAGVGGTGGGLGPLQIVPNGNVIVGMESYEDPTNNISGGVAWRYAPIVSCTSNDCAPNNCVTLLCPADITVACITDVDLDPNLASASSTCGSIRGQWITNPLITNAPGCPGTTYTYFYKAVDTQGNIGCCERVVTIDNDPPVLTVPPGFGVDCFDDIEVSINDATVTDDCAEFNLYLTAPEVVGEFGCPGTQYIYTYRLIDKCGRIVEATRTFTENANAAPTIQAPVDITCECSAGVNPNPDLATVTTSCGAGYDVTVTGPQQIGQQDCPGTIYRYTYMVTDACGRTAVDFQDFTIQNSAPIFSRCEEDTWLQFNCEDYGGEEGTIAVIEAYIASVSAYSACGDNLMVFNNFNSNNINTCINNGINTITFRATDNCGRTSFCTTTYVVVDTEAPDIIEEAQDHWEICNYNSPDNFDDWVDNNGGAVAFDGCSNENVTWSTIPFNPTFNCMGASGTTTVEVTFVARDNCGNTSETTATFNAFMGGNDFVEQDQEITANHELTLNQNRPNPFKAETNISFNLPEATNATLTIFDINGKVLKMIQGDYSAGYNEVTVNRNDLGGTGVMFYRLMTDKTSVTKSMIIMD